MPASELIGHLVDKGIHIFIGVWVLLLGYRKIGSKPGANPKWDTWHARFGKLMKVGGFILLLTALFRLVVDLFILPNVNNPQTTPRANTRSIDPLGQRGEARGVEQPPNQDVVRRTFAEAREGFKTRITESDRYLEPPQEPPRGTFELITYPSPIGDMHAYISPRPGGEGARMPLVIYKVGGFSNAIGDVAWTPSPGINDQSGAQFREAGMLMMYPSLRGAHDNPGQPEGLLGEVDDMIAAIAYAKTLDYVDPERIYLVGHSTGGTLALLTAAALPEGALAEVIAYGPVARASMYGQDMVPFNINNREESSLRSPVDWLDDIAIRTTIIEGEHGNLDSAKHIDVITDNPLIEVRILEGRDHFEYLAKENSEAAKRWASAYRAARK